MTEAITVERPRHVEVHYRVLAGLKLPGDAANLHTTSLRWRSWARGLRRAYRDAPGRLILQILPLLVDDLSAELELLRGGHLKGLDDDAGRELTRRFADALKSEDRRLTEFIETPQEVSWLELLQRCRDHLWSSADQPTPPLRVLDCPSLATGSWTHGRATTVNGCRAVAISLEVPDDHAFLQVLHEEIHPVTDPEVLAPASSTARSTNTKDPEFSVHHRLEEQAIARGEAVLRHCAPYLLDTYQDWRSRYGI